MSELQELHFTQGDDDWLEWRETVFTASIASAVVAENAFFPRTPLDLWKVRKGIEEVVVTPLMRRGNQFEPDARAMAEKMNDVVLSPACFQRGDYGASLDAIDIEHTLNCEIKIPGSGMSSPTWQHVIESGMPPDMYIWQLVHQYHVIPTDRVLFCLYCPETKAYHQIDIDTNMLESKWSELDTAWRQFQHCLDNDIPPDPIEGKDKIERADDEWQRAADDLKSAQVHFDRASSLLEDAKLAVRELSHGLPTRGAGVTVSWFEQKGRVLYNKVPELEGVDLEQYRAETAIRSRITLERDT